MEREAQVAKRLRVLVYTDSEGIGGAEISLGHLVATASAKFEIAIAGVSSTVVDAIANRRSESTKIVLPRQGVWAFIQHLIVFWRWQPDVIHINLCTPWAGMLGLATALLLPRVRVVRVEQLPLRTTHAPDLWRTRFLCLRVDAHVAVGDASARRMEDFYALGRRTVISIPNGVPDFAQESISSTKLQKVLRVGSVGRLDPMKGHDVLLRAIAQVENTELVILGDGAYRTALEQLAEALGISDRIHLPGWANNPAEHLPTFDVVALPSRSEGFPLAMVEAMLAARAVVATPVGSIPEAIIHNKTGLLVEKDDVSGLATALRQLRDDCELRIRLGEEARKMALAHFTVKSMTASYEELWYKLLAKPRSPRLWVPRPLD